MRNEELIRAIYAADVMQIEEILHAAICRKRELYPDWELFYCAAEKEKINSPEDMIRAAWEFEQRLREKYG